MRLVNQLNVLIMIYMYSSQAVILAEMLMPFVSNKILAYQPLRPSG